ncbi:hypothetical protein IMSAGC004_02993 [Bacteroidaceae bacterium]|nr:hypothetical protein IMSAGC004_02993 [Bacteroidaceae bacterium]
MGQQCLAGFSVKADDIAFQFPVRNFAEELSQRHDVLLTVAQRRDGYLEVVQAVQQVLPETLFMDRLLQILVGGGDDADVETFIRLITYRAVSSFLYSSE